jgi:hypothetical protein
MELKKYKIKFSVSMLYERERNWMPCQSKGRPAGTDGIDGTDGTNKTDGTEATTGTDGSVNLAQNNWIKFMTL